MKWLVVTIFILFTLFTIYYSGKDYILSSEMLPIADYCEYAEGIVGCDHNYCEMKCEKKSVLGGCVQSCMPKECMDYELEYCPSVTCKLDYNIYGERICNTKEL